MLLHEHGCGRATLPRQYTAVVKTLKGTGADSINNITQITARAGDCEKMQLVVYSCKHP